jgi:N-acetyl-anhydromuramyl-L-alanine amidase AmpD
MPIEIISTSLSFRPMTRLDKSAIRYLVVHTEGSKNNSDGSAASIHTYHKLPEAKKGKGWSGIGYHFVVRKSGRVERGRSLEYQGAHVEGANKLGVGICCSGNGDIADFTGAQKQSLRDLIRDLKVEFPNTTVEGHRPLVDKLLSTGKLEKKYATDKTCPGKKVSMAELQQLIGFEQLPAPQPGTRRWSNYFKDWIILARYVADTEWYFVHSKNLQMTPVRAQARWSQVPLGPPTPL